MALKKTKKFEEEVEDLITPEEPTEEVASVEKLSKAAQIVSDKFGLDNTYHVTKFNDKKSTVELTLENFEYIVSVTLKNPSAQGLEE